MRWMMSMDEILKLTSTDWEDVVNDILPLVDIGDEYHQRLAKRMRDEKINKVPIFIWEKDDHRILGNGHHRVKIAYEVDGRKC